MKRFILILGAIFIGTSSFAPVASYQNDTFKGGEWFRFRIHYGWFNASFATLQIEDARFQEKDVYHVVGKGKSTGLLHAFYKVDDRYESYFDRKTGKPYRFIRKIDEGGHTRDVQIDFDYQRGTADVFNKKHNTRESIPLPANAQDMISAFYYLRDKIDHNTIKTGDTFIFPMIYDKESFNFRIRLLGRETIKTKFGKVRCLKFRPYVFADRVFKEEESLTIWVSDDENKIPLKIKADLAVGSLEADLDAFKGLKNSFKIVVD